MTGLTNPSYGYVGFDNIGQAFLTLYGLSSFDGWSMTMYKAMDIEGFQAWIFFVGFIILCVFFSLNLVIAVIISRYHMFASRERESKAKLPHVEDPLRDDTMNMSGWRGKMRRFVRHKFFNAFILFCIFSNTIMLMCDYYGIPKAARSAMFVLNAIFTSIYLLEALLKVIALGPRRYIHSRWSIPLFRPPYRGKNVHIFLVPLT